MKRRMYLLCGVVFISCLLTACGSKARISGEVFEGEVNTYEGVTVMVAEGTARPGTVTVEILNTTDLEIDSGNEHDFGLQKEVDGKWYWLETKGEWANTAEALIYERDTPRELELTWDSRYGSLPEGHYRVIKSFFEYRGPGDCTDFLLAAEFNLD